jgi:large conductance mechanosensitive channel
MFKEFKEFAMKGNVIDLAVGVILGTAFGKIITSIVNDMLMPPIGMLLNGVNFSNLYFPLDGRSYPNLADAQAAGAPTLNYGLFLNNLIDFFIVTFVVFLLIRTINRFRKQPDPVAADPVDKVCPYCRTMIPVQATRCPHCTSQLG